MFIFLNLTANHQGPNVAVLNRSFFTCCVFTQGLKFPALPSFSDDPGKIYVLDLLHPKPNAVVLQIKGNLDLSSFNPHGISVYTDEAGEI